MRVALLFSAWIFALVLYERCELSYGGESREALAVTAPAQTVIDEYIKREMGSQRIPGLSLAVVRTGKLVHVKGYGKASLELDAPATTATLRPRVDFQTIYGHRGHVTRRSSLKACGLS